MIASLKSGYPSTIPQTGTDRRSQPAFGQGELAVTNGNPFIQSYRQVKDGLNEATSRVRTPKVILNDNTWVAPSDIVKDPSFRRLILNRETTMVQKDAVIEAFKALTSGATAFMLGGKSLNLFSPGDFNPINALLAVGIPAFFTASALLKLDRWDNLKRQSHRDTLPEPTQPPDADELSGYGALPPPGQAYEYPSYRP
jgi:hypothetical protein